MAPSCASAMTLRLRRPSIAPAITLHRDQRVNGAGGRGRQREHRRTGLGAAEWRARGQRRQRGPELARLLGRGAQPHHGVTLPFARDGDPVLRRGTSGVERRPHDSPPIVQLDGKRFFQRRANQTALCERPPPSTSRPPPRSATNSAACASWARVKKSASTFA